MNNGKGMREAVIAGFVVCFIGGGIAALVLRVVALFIIHHIKSAS